MKRNVPIFLLIVLFFVSGTIAYGQHFQYRRTDSNASILVTAATLNGESLVEGDEVGVFTEAGLCAGASVVPGNFPDSPVGVAAWGDEQGGQVDGFRPNEPIAYRIWDAGTETEIEDVEFRVINGVQNQWVQNGLVVVSLTAEMQQEQTPDISVSDEANDFGEVTVGESSDWTFTISNEGDAVLEIESVETSGDYFADNIDGGFDLDPGADREVTVTFAPEGAGDFDGSVVIASNDEDEAEVTVTLSGAGVEEPNPEIAVDPDAIDFGEVISGEQGEETLTITNNGDADLTIADVVIEGDGFSLEWEGQGGEFNWDYTRTDNNMSCLILSANLNGEDLAAGNFVGVFTEDGDCAGYSEVQEAGAQLGITAWGTEQGQDNGFAPNEDVEFRYWVSDAGREYTAEIQIINGAQQIYVANGLIVGNLSVNNFAPEDIAELVLEPNASTDVAVFFNPEEAGDYEGLITITSDDPDNGELTVDVMGAGIEEDEPNIAVEPDAIDFGNVFVGEQGEETITIGNTGDADLTVEDVTAAGDGFSVDWEGQQTIEPGGEYQVSVTFAPGEGGDFEGTITIASDDPDQGEVAVGLAGTGVERVADIAVSDESHDFGEVMVGESGDWTFTISNEGNGVLEVESVETSGDYFIDDLDGGFNLDPGASREITVTFAPEEAGEFDGGTVIMSNDADEGRIVVTLFGVGAEEPIPAIAVDPEEIDFGETLVGEQGEETLTIVNNGNADLTIDDVVIEGDGFSLEWEGQGGEFYWDYTRTDNNMSCLILSANLNGEDLAAGNFVGVFTEDGDCAGYSEVQEPGAQLGITAWGTEQGEDNGFAPDEAVEFRYWMTDAGREYTADIQIENNAQQIYVANGLIVGNLNVENFAPEDIAELVLEPEASTDVTVFFNPEEVRDYEGLITITSDDPENGELQVGVFGAGYQLEPEMVVSDDANDFGHVTVGESAQWTFSIANEGDGVLEVESVETIGDYFSDNIDEGFNINPGGAANQVVVTFAPEEAGDFEGSVVITSNDGEAAVALAGIGVEPDQPAIGVPELIDFGRILVGEMGEETLAIENVGDADLTVSDIAVEGDGFSIDWGQEIPEFDWDYTRTDNNMSCLILSAGLNGEDLAAGNFIGVFTEDGDCAGYSEVQAPGAQLGITAWGTEQGEDNGFAPNEAVEFRYWITDAGREYTADLQIVNDARQIYVANGLIVGNLTVEGYAPGDVAEEIIEPGGVLEVPVYFEPGQAGDYEGMITVTSNDPENGEVTIDLAGVGYVEMPDIELSADAHNFEEVIVGQSADWTFTITNVGNANLVVQDVVVEGDYFAADEDGGFVVEPDQEFEITVAFAPEEAGEFEGTVTIGSNDPDDGEVSIDLAGIGVGLPEIAVDPEAIDYGRVPVDSRVEEIVTIANNGLGDLVVTEISVDNEVFEVEFEGEFTLAQDEQAEIPVFFAPDEPGDFEGILTVASNDPENGEVQVALAGEGYIVAEHFEYPVTEQNHSIVANSTFIDEDAIEVGDEVGVFTPRGNCAGAGVREAEEEIVGLAAWGAEGEDDGFRQGEAFAFKVWDRSTDTEWEATIVEFIQGPETWVNGGYTVLDLVVDIESLVFDVEGVDFGTIYVDQSAEEVVTLTNTGRRGVAITNISTDNADLFAVDFEGEFELGVDESVEITITFDPVEAGEFEGVLQVASNSPNQGDISLSLAGQAELWAEIVTDPADVLDFGAVPVGDEAGDVITVANEGEIDLVISEMTIEGEGFEFGEIQDEEPEPVEFDWEYHQTDVNMSILITEAQLGGENLTPGDVVGVFTPDNDCAGYTEIPEGYDGGQLGVSAWQAEQGMDNGFQANELIRFRIFDLVQDNLGFVYEARPTIINGVENRFVPNGLMVIRLNGVMMGPRMIAEEIIEPGGSLEVPVLFTPPEGGEFNGAVTFISNARDNEEVVVELTGAGFLAADIEVSDDEHTFDPIYVGETAEWSFTVSNVGDEDLTIESVEVNHQFYDVPGDGFTLGADESRELTVTFAPEAAGVFEAILTINSDDPNEGTYEIALTGEAMWFPEIGVDPADVVDFGEVAVGEAAERTLTINNEGRAPLVVEEILIDGEGFTLGEVEEPEPGEFDWEFDQTDVNMSIIIQSAELNGETLVENDVIGAFTEAGLCAGLGIVPATFPQQQMGMAAWQAEQGQNNGFAAGEPIEFRFWDMDAGRAYVVGNVEILNHVEPVFVPNGLIVANLSAGQNLNPGEAFESVIEPGGSLEVPITFMPEDEGEFEGMVTVISNDPDEEDQEITIDLYGVGYFMQDIAVSDEAHEFDQLYVGESDEWTFTVSNEGGADLTVESIEVDNDAYMVDGDGFTLGSGESAEITVTFEPEDAGQFDATLTIASDDPDEGVVEVALSGSAVWFPDIEVDPADALDFGRHAVFSEVERNLVINNVGRENLVIDNIVVEGAGFELGLELEEGDGEVEGQEFDWDYVNTDNNMSILIQEYTLNDESLAAGDYIGVFTTNGLCAGYSEVEAPGNMLGLTAWGTEQGERNGFRANEDLEFRYFDSELGVEIDGIEMQSINHAPGRYIANGLLVCNLAGEWQPPQQAEIVIEPDGSFEAPIIFMPDDEGNYEGLVTIHSNDPYEENVEVALVGEAYYTPADIEVSDEAYDFGNLVVGEQDAWTFTITNLGQLDLEVGEIAIEGDYFAIDNEGGFALGWEESAEVTVTFAPEARGDFEGLVTINSNDDDEGQVNVGLAGTALAPVIDADPEALDFGEVIVGNEAARNLTVMNEGDADLQITDLIFGDEAFVWEEQVQREFDWEYVRTDANMSIIVLEAAIRGEQLAVGDFVGAFTPDAACAGYTEVEEAGAQLGLTAWGAEQGQDNGFQAGEEIEYRLWDTEAGREYVAEVDIVEGLANYQANGFAVVNLAAGNELNANDLDQPIVIAPGESHDLEIIFRPDETREYDTELTIVSNDPGEGELAVGLYGIGREMNEPPEWVDFQEAYNTEEGAEFTFTVAAEDPDEDQLAITFESDLPDEASITDNGDGTATVDWSVGYFDAGEYFVTFTADDDRNDPVDLTVTINVANVNRAPEFTDIPEAAAGDEGTTIEFGAAAADPDEEDVQLTAAFEGGELVDGMTFEDNGDGTAAFSWDTGYEDAGQYTLTVTVTDGDLSAEADVLITVNDVNRAPELVAEFEDVNIDEDHGEYVVGDLDDYFSDPDGDDLTYMVEGIDELNLNVDGDNILTLTPADNYFGESEVTVAADDGQDEVLAVGSVSFNFNADAQNRNLMQRGARRAGLTPAVNRDEMVADAFMVTVNSVNDEPAVVAPIEDIEVDEDPGNVVVADLDDVFGDVEDNQLEFGFAGAPDELNMSIDENNVLSFNPEENFTLPDGVEITVTAMDDDQASVDDMFMLTIIPINDPPVVVAPLDDLTVDEDPGYVVVGDLDDVFADPDSDNLEFSLNDAPGELNLAIDDNNVLTFHPADDYNLPDGFEVVVTADDGADNVQDAFTIVIAPVNDPPVVANPIDNIIIDEDPGEEVVVADLTEVFADVEDDMLDFSFAGAPGELNMALFENMLFFDPDENYNLPNGAVITVTATDDDDASVDEAFRVIIRPINDRPVWVDYPEEEINVNEGATIEFDLVATDVDNQNLAIRWGERADIPMDALDDAGDGTAHFMWETDNEDAGEYDVSFVVTDGEFVETVDVRIVVLDIRELQHFTEFQITENNHSIIVQDVTQDGETVPTLWEIGVFTPNGVLAGGVIWNAEEGQVGLAAWGDEPETQPIEGFRAGEEMNFRVWDFRADREYAATIDIVQGGIAWQINGFSIFTLSVTTARELSVEMRGGWNLISLNVSPGPEMYRDGQNEGPDVEYMLDQLAEEQQNQHNVLLFKNDVGAFYHPRSGFRNLRWWDLGEGYSIRMAGVPDGDHEMVNENGMWEAAWTGEPIPADTPLDMNAGWNIVPYYPTYPLYGSAPDFEVLAPIIDDVIIAKDGIGRFMAPGVNFSNMRDPWEEGQGYKVRLRNAVEGFQYPEQGDEGAMVGSIQLPAARHFDSPVLTGEDMSVLVTSIAGIAVDAADEMAAYTDNGMLVGSSVFDIQGRCGVAVWGDDETTENIDGLADGEAFELRLWDADRQEEISLIPISVTEGKGLVYEPDGFSMIELGLAPEIPDYYYLSQAYPNPFNAVTHLSFGMPEAGSLSVKVYDMSGRVIATLIDGKMNAGVHRIAWGGEDIASGIYIVKLESENFNAARKVVLMR